MAPSLRPQRRIVTTHNGTKSAVMIDDFLQPIPGFASDARVLWRSHQYPALVAEDTDEAREDSGMYARGSLIRVVDFPPHSQGHNHRTSSLDYGIVMEGTLEMLLDDGSKTVVSAGDIVIQRATMHQWNNPTDKSVRMIFILLPARAPVIGGVKYDDANIPENLRNEYGLA